VALVVHHATSRAWNPSGLAVLLLGICTVYSLDRVLDAPSDPLAEWLKRALWIAALGSATMTSALLWKLPPPTAALVPVVGAGALLYPTIKRLPLTKTVFVPLVWTWCAIALPFDDGSWFGWHWVLQPIAVPLFLLLASGALLCDLKDEIHDRCSGVASLPAMLGARRAIWIAVGLAVAAGLCSHAEGRPGLALSALGLGLSALRPALLATDVVGPLLVDVILTLPGFLIAAHVV
jgi:4-hydroxybenzoate polyprenyltransferase